MIKLLLKSLNSRKGFSLIIVILAMMIFAILGWTLTSMQSGDFEVNSRSFDSERALYLADAGVQEAIYLLFNRNDTFDNDTEILNRTLGLGQYQVNRVTNGSIVTVVSSGFIPNITSPRATRQIRLMVTLGGGFANTLAVIDLLDWSLASAHTVGIDANISAGNYSGDGDATYNELGQDYSNSSPLKPPGSGDRNLNAAMPTIEMDWFYYNSSAFWPYPSSRDITGTTDGSSTSGNTVYVNIVNFFTNMEGQVVRNLGSGHGTWNSNDWAVIAAVNVNGKQATIDGASRGLTWRNDPVRLARRYSDTNPKPAGPVNGINYIGAEIVGRTRADTLIDLRNNDFSFYDESIVCEGDIIVVGTNKLSSKFSSSGGAGSHERPAFATKEGNITSIASVSGADKREISGLIFSKNGTISLNYLRYPTLGVAAWHRGCMAYGRRVILDGDITMRRIESGVPEEGEGFGSGDIPTSVTWQEQ
ncbi:MAG: hypothetical protein ABIG46_01730 [Candidatus Omnitrophota bacterium]|nr:hypothetical protein [Candidatus Omnitrophota bacterium]